MNLQKTITEKSKKWQGLITFCNFTIDSDEAREIDAFLKLATDIPQDVYMAKIQRLKELCKYKEVTRENSIVMTGRTVFARRLANDTTYTGIINYGALGTGSTAVGDSQTALTTEVKRKLVATYS